MLVSPPIMQTLPHPPVALRRIEQERAGCYPNSAKKLADRFGLRVLELFTHTEGEDHLTVVDAKDLRERLSLTG